MKDPFPSPHEITQLLAEWSNGNQTALAKLYPLVYDELHRMASRLNPRVLIASLFIPSDPLNYPN